MRKLFTILLVMAFSLCAYSNEYHYYFSMDNQGKLDKYEINAHSFVVTVKELTLSESGYVKCEITIDCPNEAKEYVILRRHANGAVRGSDESDAQWNMALQPSINPNWCAYEVLEDGEDGCLIRFVDTFESSLLEDELSTVNALRYYLRDNVTGHTLNIQIANVFFYEIVTGINGIGNDNIPVEYYDLSGNKLQAPTSGIIIEKKGNIVCKKLYR